MQKREYLLILCMITLFIAAIPFSAVGPLIPFMASELNIDEMEYNSMLFWISVATLFSQLTSLAIQRKGALSSSLLIFCFVWVAIFSVVFAFMSNMTAQIIIISFIKYGNLVIVMGINIIVFSASSYNDASKWTSLAHAAFGLGSMVGTILVDFMGQKVFILVPVAYLLITPALCILNDKQIQRVDGQLQFKSQYKEGSFCLIILMFYGIFISMGMEANISNWLPTYAVQTKIATEQGAALFASLFWALVALFRFISTQFILAKDSTILTISCWAQLAAGVICVLISALHHPLASAYVTSILYGITLSVISPLLLTIVYKYKIYINHQAFVVIMLAYGMATGLLPWFTGIFMNSGPEMLQYSMLGYGVILLIIIYLIIYALKKEGQEEIKSWPLNHQEYWWK